MFKKILFMIAFTLPLSATNAWSENEDMFASDDEFLAVSAPVAVKTTTADASNVFSEFLSKYLSAATILPIDKAEKTYCYIVDYAEKDYTGYMIDGLAVKGYCGEISAQGKALFTETLYNNPLAFSTSKSNCKISPKIMLRYVYGVDYTDILLSAPCHSLTFFHGTEITTVNAAPGAAIIDKITETYSSLQEEFHSPALIGQMVGNGQPQTQAQKEIIRRKTQTAAPLKKWSTDNQASDTKQSEKSGWNKLR